MTQQHTRHIKEADKKMLWFMAAGRCSRPDCDNHCVEPPTDLDGPAPICEHAHIFAHSKHGPRPNPDGFSEKTNAYENLILLCSNDHIIVDKQENKYSVATLMDWKNNHESWVAERLRREEFTHVELESIITWLTDDVKSPSEDLTLRPPRDKMQLNGFSPQVQQYITQGLMRVGEIRTYIEHRGALETNFAERLLNPLMNAYNQRRLGNLSSDYIFHDLWGFACGNSLDFAKRSAGLAVIVYFFDRCELFEK